MDDHQVSSTQAKTKEDEEKQPFVDTRKQIWIITSTTTQQVVTYEMLNQNGLKVDEWFHVTDGPGHISIIHTSKAASAERIAKAMEELGFKDETPGKSFTLHGFDMITASGGRGRKDGTKLRDIAASAESLLHIENHQGFKKIAEIVEKLNAGGDDDEGFQFWIKEKAGIFALKKGLLLRTMPNKKRKAETAVTDTVLMDQLRKMLKEEKAKTASLERLCAKNHIATGI
jgi:hypothetical protein